MVRQARGGLLSKLLLATLLPSLLVLGSFAWVAHEVARRSLEDELGRRLGTAAAGVAMAILPEQIRAIGKGDENRLTYARIVSSLAEARRRLGVRRVAVVASDLSGRGDTDGRIGLGARAHEFSLDAVEIEAARRGAPVASPLFQGKDGRLYKRAYAAVGDESGVAGYAVVEASADYLVSLGRLRRWIALAGIFGLGGMVVLTSLLARRLTGPLRRLAGAAERIGRGQMDVVVPVETRDEVGLLAARLDEMRAALRARDENLQMMLAGIAHEVRNPLGGLELYAGLLRESLAGQQERLAEVGRIEREVAHLKDVVTDFLEYARRPPPELGPVPVRDLLLEVAEVVGGTRGTRNIAVAAPAGLVVRGDRAQLRRALVNLVRNGIVACDDAGEIAVSAQPVAGGGQGLVEIAVSDSGPGIPEGLRARIFEPFFTTREKGTGLGLAFVRDIVRAHGSDIAVGTGPKGGARLSFRLPVAG